MTSIAQAREANLIHPLFDQHVDVERCFEEFFAVENFDRIVELGTGNGHFTKWLAPFVNTVFTWDIRKLWNFKMPENVVFKQASVAQIDVMAEIRDIITAPGHVLLMCDNGNKPLEANVYSHFLKPRDMLLVHDYATPGWPWKGEFFDKDIPYWIEAHPDWDEHMHKHVWFAGRKRRDT